MSITIGAIASALAIAYPIAESIIKERNSKEINARRKELDQVLSRFNLKLDDLRKGLEMRGIQYNQLMDALAYASPVGNAAKQRRLAEKKYRDDVETINSTIASTTDKMNQYAALENQRINDLESKGVIKTILGE